MYHNQTNVIQTELQKIQMEREDFLKEKQEWQNEKTKIK